MHLLGVLLTISNCIFGDPSAKLPIACLRYQLSKESCTIRITNGGDPNLLFDTSFKWVRDRYEILQPVLRLLAATYKGNKVGT